MAEAEEDTQVNSPLFLEVSCKALGKNFRFAPGTKAGFAASLISRMLEIGSPAVSHIESVKEGEEPISFGPDAVLLDYGNGWKLQTVAELDLGTRKPERVPLIKKQDPNVSTGGSHPANRVSTSGINFWYFAKILVAFISLFVLGAIFTLALENLPRLVLFINSFV